MPQNKKDCQITLQHPSYIKLYEILKSYEEPHLRDIFLQQVAYNCAIRKFVFDINDKKNENVLFLRYSDLTTYGLSTYSGTSIISDYDTAVPMFDIKQHMFDFPFLDALISRINQEIETLNSRPDSPPNSRFKREKYDLIDVIDNTTYDRYPIVQKKLTVDERDRLTEFLNAEHNEEWVLPLFANREGLPNKLSEGTDHILLNALYIVKAFFYFDAIYFYGDSIAMIERSPNLPSEKPNYARHDNRYIKRYLKVITPYIKEKRYFDLI